MTRMIALVALLGCLIMEAPGLAADSADLARENADLRQRVDRLEKQVEQLQTDGKAVPPAAPGEQKKSLWSTLDIQFYGYIKADAAWDSSGVFPGDFVLFTRQGRDGDNEFNLTAKQTRLGFKVKGPDVGGLMTSGRVEADFYGSAGAENKPSLLVRHAYMQLDSADGTFGILAGQTSDVISPLVPYTLNYTVLWDAGNIGYRHPQIRLTKDFSLAGDTTLKLAGAISRTISSLEGQNPAPFTNPGADAGFPTLQGRVGLTFPCLGYKPTTAGVSGHWGQEKFSSDNRVDSWSLNLDVLQPINPVVTVKGEAYVGQDLGDYFGGIGQGVSRVNATRPYHAVGDRGGWAAVGLGPWAPWSFNVGAGIDDVDDDDVNANARTQNYSIFANAIYAVNEHADVGVELSEWRTNYKNADDVDDFRVQASFIYKF